MSKKPLKKSELKKDIQWRTKKRNKKVLINPEYHVIICEGTKTEPNYFEGLKNEINGRFKNRIELKILPTGKGRREALSEAKRIVSKSVNHIGYVWIVYDKDDFPKDEFDNVVFMCKSINKNNDKIDDDELKTYYNVLWSNECIEFWFLLHFIDLKSDISRNEYIDKINEQFKNNELKEEYKKNLDNIYEILRTRLEYAKSRAKDIIKENKNSSPSNIKPGTTVYKIFDKLEDYLE